MGKNEIKKNMKECLVTRCENCETINVIPGRGYDGCRCAHCKGGPLKPLTHAILRDKETNEMKVQVSVERDELDRLIKDVEAVNKMVVEMKENLEGITEEKGAPRSEKIEF